MSVQGEKVFEIEVPPSADMKFTETMLVDAKPVDIQVNILE